MRYTTIALLGAVLVATALLSLSLYRQFRHRAQIEKPIYAALHEIEFEHRSAPLRGPLFLIGATDVGDVIGLPTADPRFPNAWIAGTQTRGTQGIYLFPESARPRLACGEVDRLFAGPLTARSIAPAVRRYLHEHCSR